MVGGFAYAYLGSVYGVADDFGVKGLGATYAAADCVIGDAVLDDCVTCTIGVFT